jgi:hypothetical protein
VQEGIVLNIKVLQEASLLSEATACVLAFVVNLRGSNINLHQWVSDRWSALTLADKSTGRGKQPSIIAIDHTVNWLVSTRRMWPQQQTLVGMPVDPFPQQHTLVFPQEPVSVPQQQTLEPLSVPQQQTLVFPQEPLSVPPQEPVSVDLIAIAVSDPTTASLVNGILDASTESTLRSMEAVQTVPSDKCLMVGDALRKVSFFLGANDAKVSIFNALVNASYSAHTMCLFQRIGRILNMEWGMAISFQLQQTAAVVERFAGPMPQQFAVPGSPLVQQQSGASMFSLGDPMRCADFDLELPDNLLELLESNM